MHESSNCAFPPVNISPAKPVADDQFFDDVDQYLHSFRDQFCYSPGLAPKNNWDSDRGDFTRHVLNDRYERQGVDVVDDWRSTRRQRNSHVRNDGDAVPDSLDDGEILADFVISQ